MINAMHRVVHVGPVKNASLPCSFGLIYMIRLGARVDFQRRHFADGLSNFVSGCNRAYSAAHVDSHAKTLDHFLRSIFAEVRALLSV